LKLFPLSGHAANLATFAADPSGNFWLTHNGMSSLMVDGKLTPKALTNETQAYVQGVCPSHGGGWWFASEGQLRKFDGVKVTQDFGPAPWGHDPLPSLIETRQAALIVGTDKDGIFIVKPHEPPVNLKRATGFPTDWISCLCEDREGNIWVGSGGNGLIMLRASGASTVEPPDQWQGRPVLCVTPAKDGALWIGSEGSGLYRFKDQVWTHFYTGLPNYYVWSVCEDPGGRLWAGTWGGGLLVQDGDQWRRAPGVENLDTPMTALLADGPSQLWIGTAAGLLRYDHGRTNWYRHSGAQLLSEVRCVQKDQDGKVWFGMLGGGLGCLSGENLRVFRKSDGLSSDYIQC
jgi:ligand-binding sensor domain-containing protein